MKYAIEGMKADGEIETLGRYEDLSEAVEATKAACGTFVGEVFLGWWEGSGGGYVNADGERTVGSGTGKPWGGQLTESEREALRQALFDGNIVVVMYDDGSKRRVVEGLVRRGLLREWKPYAWMLTDEGEKVAQAELERLHEEIEAEAGGAL